MFERFLNEYPSSVYAEKVNDYLVEVYMNTRSYEVALRSIEKITHPSARILEAKQKLLFRMGTQLFAQADYRNAIDYFTRSLQLGQYNQKTKADAYYWRGESKYRLERYPEAANDMRLYLEFATDKIHRSTDWLFIAWDTVCSSRNNIIPHATGLFAVCRTDGRRRLL